MSKRVAVVSFDDVPPVGGQGRYVAGLERQMPLEGFHIEMISPKRGPWGESPRIPRRTRRPPIDFSMFLRHHIQRVAQEVQPDLWHYQGGPGGVMVRRHPPDAPLVYTSHHPYRTAHGRNLGTMPMGYMESRGYKLAEHVIAVSPSTAASLMADSGVPRERISVIPSGVDTGWLQPPPDDTQRDTILFVGRLIPAKGVQYFVAMFRTLAQEHPELVAEVCGDGVLLPVAMGAAEKFGGRLRIRGRVEDEDLRDAYRRARVLVMPSRFEGLGLVALEAMACGTPVVGMDVPGLRDMRDTGITLVKLDDQKALHDEVNRLLLDGARWRELSAQAHAVVRSSYSWESVRPRIAEVYRSVLPSSSTQAA